MRNQEKKLVERNQDQLSKGLSVEGDLFGTYSELTEQLALFDNPRKPKIAGEPFNFEYTGDTFDNMFADAPGNEIVFGTEGELKNEFAEKYPGAFGLSDENLKQYIRTDLLPLFLPRIKKLANL